MKIPSCILLRAVHTICCIKVWNVCTGRQMPAHICVTKLHLDSLGFGFFLHISSPSTLTIPKLTGTREYYTQVQTSKQLEVQNRSVSRMHEQPLSLTVRISTFHMITRSEFCHIRCNGMLRRGLRKGMSMERNHTIAGLFYSSIWITR